MNVSRRAVRNIALNCKAALCGDDDHGVHFKGRHYAAKYTPKQTAIMDISCLHSLQ